MCLIRHLGDSSGSRYQGICTCTHEGAGEPILGHHFTGNQHDLVYVRTPYYFDKASAGMFGMGYIMPSNYVPGAVEESPDSMCHTIPSS